MTQITIEYMIMSPLLIMQIILFPFVAGLIMNGWVDSRRTLVLQETASNLGSSIQQLYSALNHGTISTGNVTNTLELPMFIEDYAYSGTGTLRATSGPTVDSTKILYITLSLRGTNIASTTSITLGSNVNWDSHSTLYSNSTDAGILGEKLANGTIVLSFI
jgi:hypothetical protein